MPTQKSTQKSTQKPTVVACESVNINKLSFSELDSKNERSVAQAISYPRYEHIPHKQTNFIVKTNEIKLTQYGLPLMNEKTKAFIESDKDREYIRVPYDPSQPNCVAFFTMLEKIDKAMVEKHQSKIFGANAKKYKYIPLVREPAEQDEDEEDEGSSNKKKMEKFKYCKVKIDTDYNNNRKISTAIFSSESGKPELQEGIDTITDLEEYIPWNSTCRFVVMFNKLWAAKVSKNKAPKDYGLVMKCLQLEITEKATSASSIKDAFSSYAFGSNDAEEIEQEQDEVVDEDDAEEQVQKNTKGKTSAVVEEEEDDDDEEEDQEEEEDDDDDEEQEDDDEEDSEVEEVTEKLSKAKVKAVKSKTKANDAKKKTKKSSR